jgi:hypothetical protein
MRLGRPSKPGTSNVMEQPPERVDAAPPSGSADDVHEHRSSFFEWLRRVFDPPEPSIPDIEQQNELED